MSDPVLENKFDPANHEYVTHPTYTGSGCCICGKPEPGHKAPKEKPSST